MKDVVYSPEGIPVCYEVRGTGAPAMVFVHGWSCDRTYWREQLDHFAQFYQVVAIDLAGHGESGLGRLAWTMQAFGEDVVTVTEKLELDQAVLIGHSMGGDVVVEAARRMPGRAACLVWVDVYRTLGEPRSRGEAKDFLAPFRDDFVATTRKFVEGMFRPGSDEALVEWVAADMSSAPPEVALSALEEAITFDRHIPKALRQLRVPIVAINPDYRPTNVEALRRHGVKVVIMEGVGHFLMMEDPERFNRLLGDVIKEIGRPKVSS